MNKAKILSLDTALIVPSPHQPRVNIDQEKLDGLIQSIRANGIIQPLVVKKINSSKYELICGHRRLKAAKTLGFESVPCILCSASESESAVLALIENIQREDLSFIEEAKGIKKIIDKYYFTQNEVASVLGVSQSNVANKLRVLNLSAKQLERISNFSLSERHARALLRLPSESTRDDILSEIIVKGYNVEQTEKLIDTITNPKLKSKAEPKFVVNDVRLFVNSINKAIRVMKNSGIAAKSVKEENENFIKYTVTIPKK